MGCRGAAAEGSGKNSRGLAGAEGVADDFDRRGPSTLVGPVEQLAPVAGPPREGAAGVGDLPSGRRRAETAARRPRGVPTRSECRRASGRRARSRGSDSRKCVLSSGSGLLARERQHRHVEPLPCAQRGKRRAHRGTRRSPTGMSLWSGVPLRPSRRHACDTGCRARPVGAEDQEAAVGRPHLLASPRRRRRSTGSTRRARGRRPRCPSCRRASP